MLAPCASCAFHQTKASSVRTQVVTINSFRRDPISAFVVSVAVVHLLAGLFRLTRLSLACPMCFLSFCLFSVWYVLRFFERT
jgi:hypothetical protein